uniref:Uncharacterized protein n=1 Tax=Arundo donax TaxID=35708 RepID=A0A0A9CIZ5_ARUDO
MLNHFICSFLNFSLLYMTFIVAGNPAFFEPLFTRASLSN